MCFDNYTQSFVHGPRILDSITRKYYFKKIFGKMFSLYITCTVVYNFQIFNHTHYNAFRRKKSINREIEILLQNLYTIVLYLITISQDNMFIPIQFGFYVKNMNSIHTKHAATWLIWIEFMFSSIQSDLKILTIINVFPLQILSWQ